MNPFLLLFAIFYFAQHLLDSWLTWLNICACAVNTRIGALYFQDKISLDEYQKGIAYTREKARFGMIASWVEVPIFWGLVAERVLRQGGYGCAGARIRNGRLLDYCISPRFQSYSSWFLFPSASTRRS